MRFLDPPKPKPAPPAEKPVGVLGFFASLAREAAEAYASDDAPQAAGGTRRPVRAAPAKGRGCAC